jgi:hypothetical protein
VKRVDYVRVLSQFWADGPASETPPGHWFSLLYDVSDHPNFERKWAGVGPELYSLEWDVKSYLTLGGVRHDAAIACWSLKGWYDSPRPISAIRAMASYGLSSDSTLPFYHPGGLPLLSVHIELVTADDSLAGDSNQHVNKIKMKSWKGFGNILHSSTDVGHLGRILAENWIPYQRPSFVTPPIAGYVSGHSTFSRAVAMVMTKMTGSPFFQGGIAEYVIPQNSNFLVFEKGLSQDIHLQWAMYRDASDEASLSRIWGGIHPFFDDFQCRKIGEQIRDLALSKAVTYISSSSLPVTFIKVSAVENNYNVVLNWEFADEVNADYYSVYASSDGVPFDREVAKVLAKGTDHKQLRYEIVDKNALKKNLPNCST